MWIRTALAASLALLLSPAVHGFSFAVDTTTPVQCGVVNFEWQGGQPPFILTIIVRPVPFFLALPYTFSLMQSHPRSDADMGRIPFGRAASV